MPRKPGIRRRRRNDLPPDWGKRRRQVLEEAGHWCEAEKILGHPGPRCTKVATEVHHDKPRAMGGSNARENLYAVCHTCHVELTNMPAVPEGW